MLRLFVMFRTVRFKIMRFNIPRLCDRKKMKSEGNNSSKCTHLTKDEELCKRRK